MKITEWWVMTDYWLNIVTVIQQQQPSSISGGMYVCTVCIAHFFFAFIAICIFFFVVELNVKFYSVIFVHTHLEMYMFFIFTFSVVMCSVFERLDLLMAGWRWWEMDGWWWLVMMNQWVPQNANHKISQSANQCPSYI